MSVSAKKKTNVLDDSVDVTTDFNPIVPGAAHVSGTPQPEGVVSTTPLPRAGAVSYTAPPIAGSVTVTSPHGDAEKPTQASTRVGEDGFPV